MIALLQLCGMILVIAVVAMIAYGLVVKIVQAVFQTDRDGAKRIIANFLKNDNYDIQNDDYFKSEIISEYFDLMSQDQIIKLLRKNYLFEFSSNGFSCINFYITIDDEKKIFAEQRFRDLLSQNLFVHGMCSEVLVDWKKCHLGNAKDNITVDYLCLRYAKDKNEEEYITRCNEEERRKVANNYKNLADDDVEINE